MGIRNVQAPPAVLSKPGPIWENNPPFSESILSFERASASASAREPGFCFGLLGNIPGMPKDEVDDGSSFKKRAT